MIDNLGSYVYRFVHQLIKWMAKMGSSDLSANYQYC